MRNRVWGPLNPRVLVRVSIAAMKHQVGEERVFLVAYTFHHWGKSGQELKQGWNWEAETDAEVMEGCYLLACFTRFVQSAFLYHRTTREGTTPTDH